MPPSSFNSSSLTASTENSRGSFLNTSLQNIVNEKYPMDKLIITKSLRSGYKNPQQIAHKVLADRITARDPGNKPNAGDRIPFVYIHNINKKALQGDKIEIPSYIVENNIKIDYSFYITNQIMKPVAQIYALIVENLDEFKHPKDYYKQHLKIFLKNKEPIKAYEKVNNMKFKDACDIVFGEILRVANNKKNKTREITDFFKPFKI